MNSVNLSEVLRLQYQSPVKVLSFQVASVDQNRIILEVELEIGTEAPSKTFVMVTRE